LKNNNNAGVAPPSIILNNTSQNIHNAEIENHSSEVSLNNGNNQPDIKHRCRMAENMKNLLRPKNL